ncbi:uncharacterized protein METZ01_LOCUS236260 [marine metagenome]|uniref:Uncharacterized protein n=1 Tax=marine metagenome TaxID=408172 RepID=A0A382H7Z6_9ZZZZ
MPSTRGSQLAFIHSHDLALEKLFAILNTFAGLQWSSNPFIPNLLR